MLLRRGLDFPSGATSLYGSSLSRMLEGNYAQVGNTFLADNGNCALVTDPDGVSGGTVFRCNADSYGGGSNRVTMRKVLADGAVTTLHIASRMYLSALPQTSSEIPLPAIWKDGSNDVIAELRVTTTGVIRAYDDGGTLLGSTSAPVVGAAGWYHIEGMLTCSTGGSGVLKVWVEGVEKLNLTGLTTSASSTSQIERGVDPSATSSNPAVYFKDTVEQDSSGAQNNSQIGPLVVCDLTENGDVSSGWTRSSGSSDWQLINEVGPNDTGYIAADDSPPAPSIMTLTSLPADIVGVRGLVTYYRGLKEDSGDGNIQAALSPNGSDWDSGADSPMTTAALYYSDVSELSPATTDPWTPSEVNAAEIRFDRTT